MAAKKNTKWTPAQRKKFAATMKRKKAVVTSVPLDAIPARSKAKPKGKGPVPSKMDLAIDLLDLAVKMLRAAK